MKRQGPLRQGRLHRLVHDALPDAGSAISFDALLWKVARSDNEVRGGEIPGRVMRPSVRRALNHLVARQGAILAPPRRILSLQMASAERTHIARGRRPSSRCASAFYLWSRSGR